MRKNAGVVVMGIFACLVVVMPVVAQDVGGDLGGIPQWLSWLIQSWFGGSMGDAAELAPHIPPGGQPLAEDPEMGGYSMPGGLSAPGDSPEVGPYIPVGGSPASGESPEAGGYIAPGGLSAPGDSSEVAPYIPIGGSPASGESPETGPYIMPGG